MGTRGILYEYIYQGEETSYEIMCNLGTYPDSVGKTLWTGIDDLSLFSDCLTLAVL